MWNFIVTICVTLVLLVCVIVSGVMYGRTTLIVCDNKYYGYVTSIRELKPNEQIKIQILTLKVYTRTFEFKEEFEIQYSKNITISTTIELYKDCRRNPSPGYTTSPQIIHSNTIWQPALAYSITAFVISLIFLVAMCTTTRCSRDIIILNSHGGNPPLTPFV